MTDFPDYQVVPAEAIEEQSHMKLPDGEQQLIWYHDDEALKRAGFDRPPVEGTRCISYLIHTFAHSDQGREYLQHGRNVFGFGWPIYPGDDLRVETRQESEAEVVARAFKDAGGEHGEVEAANCRCAVVDPGEAPPFDISPFEERPLPDYGKRPEASLKNVPGGLVLGTYRFTVDDALVKTLVQTDYQEKGSRVLDRDVNADAVITPAFFLEHCNKMIRFNFFMEKSDGWSSIGNTVTWRRPMRPGEELSIRARVRRSWDDEGLGALCCVFEYLVLDAAAEPLAFVSYLQTLQLYREGVFTPG